MFLSAHLFSLPHIHPCIHLPMYLCLCVHLYFCASVHTFMYLHPSACTSTHTSIDLFVESFPHRHPTSHRSIHPFTHPSTLVSSDPIHLYPFTCPPTPASIRARYFLSTLFLGLTLRPPEIGPQLTSPVAAPAVPLLTLRLKATLWYLWSTILPSSCLNALNRMPFILFFTWTKFSPPFKTSSGPLPLALPR